MVTLVVAKNGTPKFSKSRVLKDEGCPTCGSMDFAITQIMKKSNFIVERKFRCHICKKFWHDDIPLL